MLADPVDADPVLRRTGTDDAWPKVGGSFADDGAKGPWPARGDRVGFSVVSEAPATFGELLQGREPVFGHDFLVTFPITLGAIARFCGFRRSRHLYVFPSGKTKALRAATLFLESFGIETGGILQICSTVEEGKGLASSSADLVATLRALAAYFEIDLPVERMCDIIREIEPTDGVMFDESVAFLHRRVELDRLIGRLPSLCVLAIDEGGMVDTVAYNKTRFDFSAEERELYGALLDDISRAICEKNVKQIGRAATVSTRLHQKRNPKRLLDRLEALVPASGADGIINCHSGTLLGLCFDARKPDALDTVARAEDLLVRAFQQKVYRFFSR